MNKNNKKIKRKPYTTSCDRCKKKHISCSIKKPCINCLKNGNYCNQAKKIKKQRKIKNYNIKKKTNEEKLNLITESNSDIQNNNGFFIPFLFTYSQIPLFNVNYEVNDNNIFNMKNDIKLDFNQKQNIKKDNKIENLNEPKINEKIISLNKKTNDEQIVVIANMFSCFEKNFFQEIKEIKINLEQLNKKITILENNSENK